RVAFFEELVMSMGKHVRQPKHMWLTRLSVAALVGVLATYSVAWAGHSNGRNSSVGGVSISTEGVLSQPDLSSVKLTREAFVGSMSKVSPEMTKRVELRKVSVKAVEAALVKAKEGDIAVNLPDEIRFLAGIQRIQYILV